MLQVSVKVVQVMERLTIVSKGRFCLKINQRTISLPQHTEAEREGKGIVCVSDGRNFYVPPCWRCMFGFRRPLVCIHLHSEPPPEKEKHKACKAAPPTPPVDRSCLRHCRCSSSSDIIAREVSYRPGVGKLCWATVTSKIPQRSWSKNRWMVFC